MYDARCTLCRFLELKKYIEKTKKEKMMAFSDMWRKSMSIPQMKRFSVGEPAIRVEQVCLEIIITFI